MNRARNADHIARTCERFVCSKVKITIFCVDYQTWRTHLFEKLCTMYQRKVDVDMLSNAVKRVLADVSSVSPSFCSDEN